jgi:hypothetical protein
VLDLLNDPETGLTHDRVERARERAAPSDGALAAIDVVIDDSFNQQRTSACRTSAGCTD